MSQFLSSKQLRTRFLAPSEGESVPMRQTLESQVFEAANSAMPIAHIQQLKDAQLEKYLVAEPDSTTRNRLALIGEGRHNQAVQHHVDVEDLLNLDIKGG